MGVMTTEDLPALTLLLQAYLNIDWLNEYGEPWLAVQGFATNEPIAIDLSAEVEGLIAQDGSEEELQHLIVEEMGSGYLPEADGWTYREWLRELQTRVAEACR